MNSAKTQLNLDRVRNSLHILIGDFTQTLDKTFFAGCSDLVCHSLSLFPFYSDISLTGERTHYIRGKRHKLNTI